MTAILEMMTSHRLEFRGAKHVERRPRTAINDVDGKTVKLY